MKREPDGLATLTDWAILFALMIGFTVILGVAVLGTLYVTMAVLHAIFGVPGPHT